MANQEQLAILRQSVEAWNHWREKNHDVSVDLSGADLRAFDLRRADLRGADLSGADLREANLLRANFRGAILIYANLVRANLMNADLRDGELSSANLVGAKLRGADLRGADLRSVRLEDANLRKADLRGADLRQAKLNGADLRGADLTGANLRGAELGDANLYEARLEGTELHERRFPAREPHKQRWILNEAVPDDLRDGVYFTAIYPKEARVETWNTLLVYIYLHSAFKDIRQDAERFKGQIQIPKEVTSLSSTQIVRGTEITIVPSCDGLVFNPGQVTVKWMEDYHLGNFRFRADKLLADDAAKGQINIYVGPIMIGTLKFAMLFRDKTVKLTSNEEVHSRMYRQEQVFVSYSHKDTDIVLACKKAYEALGFNILIDVDTLRAGQVWNIELMRMIESATIFQLFWSQNSAKSRYCRQEWEHALKREEEGFIRPCYWEKPMPKPPKKLSNSTSNICN